KGEVEAIRGVSADYAIQKLLEKDLIVISGRNESLPGHPLVYATSRSFMDYFGINSPDELPKIKEVLAEQIIEPTIVNGAEAGGDDIVPDEDGNNLAVSENGELIEGAADDTTGVEDEILTDSEVIGPDTDEPGEEEVAFDDEKKQVTEEVPGNEKKDEEPDGEGEDKGDED